MKLRRMPLGPARSLPLLILLSVLIQLTIPAAAHAQEARRKVDRRLGFEGPQLALAESGAVIMLWARPTKDGHDLYLARRDAQGRFDQATKLNETPVRILPLDEARPALTTGPEGLVAVAWLDLDGDVWVARGHEDGANVEAPVRVNRREGNPERNFAHLAIDARGSIWVAWLDAREAPKQSEEPAQLYAARIERDRGPSPERNLTAGFTESVCGCCRPFVRADRFGVEVYFRNTNEEGYRDIHRIQAGLDGEFREPERMGPPTWKISGCPMAGPVADAERAIWRDGSTGQVRIVESVGGERPLRTVIDADPTFTPINSPRRVDGTPDGEWALLVPGNPTGKLLRRRDGRWSVWVRELPDWCSSAVILDGQLLMTGDRHGELQLEGLALPE